MTIEVNENIVGIWFVGFGQMDFLAGISKRDDGKVEMTCRTRRYNSPDPFDPKDEKQWYTVVRNDLDDTIAKVRHMVEILMQSFPGGEKWEILRGDRTVEQFMEEYTKLPFVHVKTVTPINDTVH